VLSADAYFADGITDEVRGKLATLGGLKVITSSSVGQYKVGQAAGADRQEMACSTSWSARSVGRNAPDGQSRVRMSPELVLDVALAYVGRKAEAIREGEGGVACTRYRRMP
jgi:TolB-like protein